MIKFLNKYNENLIHYDTTMVEAMSLLDKSIVKTLFLVDKDDHLLGTITDGDIRRALLKGTNINSTVENIYFKSPRFLIKEDIVEAERVMRECRVSAVPVLDKDRNIINIYYDTEIAAKMDSTVVIDVPVVIMAGGQGKRLYPFTKILPKPLIPIADTPISERIIQSFLEYGCKRFYMVVNYKGNMIKSYYSDSSIDAEINFVDEQKPLGTGGGLKLLDNELSSTFVLTNCDILILDDIRDILVHHKENSNDVTMVCSLKNFEIPYGVVNFTEGGEISSFEEKPRMNFFTNTGYYIVEPTVMKYIEQDECIGMPDIIERMKKDGCKVGVYPIGENSWLDMGQFDSMEGMERRLREMRIE